MLQFGFIRVVTTIACRHIGKCRNVDFSRTSNAQSFHHGVKSCELHLESSGVSVGPPMIQFVS